MQSQIRRKESKTSANHNFGQKTDKQFHNDYMTPMPINPEYH